MRTLHLPIADPCHEDWDAMEPAERGRFCQVCVKQVHDLSSMTEPQARAVLREAEGSRICVRYRHDDEGRIRFADRAPAVPANTCTSVRTARWPGAAAVLAIAVAACTPHDRGPSEQEPTVQAPIEEPVMVGKLEVQSVPEQPQSQPHEAQEAKGEIVAIDPEPQDMGEVEAVEPTTPVQELKGDVAVPMPATKMGSMRATSKPLPFLDEPCDR